MLAKNRLSQLPPQDFLETFDTLFPIFLIIVFFFMSFTFCIGSNTYDINVPDNLGNFQKNVNLLREKEVKDNFSFIVMGDTKGGGEITKSIFRKICYVNSSFTIILGDFLKRPSLEEHRYFTNLIRKTTYHRPIFLVAGNHDVKGDNPASLSLFEELYGPSNFYFTLNDCLFIFLNGSHTKYLDICYQFLKQTLASEAGTSKHIFIFAHKPPFIRDNECNFIIPGGAQKFLDLFKRYQVDYLFSGQYHSYYRQKRDGTVYLIPGCGGAKNKSEKTDPTYRAIKVSVQRNTITEQILSTTAERRWSFDYFVHLRLLPFFRKIYASFPLHS
jgi:predicted phosphodiesterase